MANAQGARGSSVLASASKNPNLPQSQLTRNIDMPAPNVKEHFGNGAPLSKVGRKLSLNEMQRVRENPTLK